MSSNSKSFTNKNCIKTPKNNVNNTNDRKRKIIAKLNNKVPKNGNQQISKITNVNFVPGNNSRSKSGVKIQEISQLDVPKEEVENKMEEMPKQSLSMKLHLAEVQLQKIKTILSRTENEIISKNKEISELKHQMKIRLPPTKRQEKSNENKERHQNDAENSKYLYRKCIKLEKKVKDMESFLRDYGLIWVDDKYDSPNFQSQMISNYINECYDQMMLNIAQLNSAARKDEIVIERNEKGASFKSQPCMSLKFYKNGLVVQDGLLRPYHEPSAESFISDILDGYFPSELQRDYPNGVPFKVEDHRNETFLGKGFGFSGQGHKLGKMSEKKNDQKLKLQSQVSDRQSSSRGCNIEYDRASAFKSNGLNSKTKSAKSTISLTSNNLLNSLFSSRDNQSFSAHIRSHIKNEIKDIKIASPEHITRKLSNTGNPVLSNSRSTSRHNSLDRSYFRICGSSSSNQFRLRSRSVNSLGHGCHSVSHSGTRVTSSKSNTSSTRSGYERDQDDRKTSPLAVYVNEPSKKEGEFRLKIRSLNGCILYLVYVTADNSVDELYKLMNRTVPKYLRKKYKIVMNGPGIRQLNQMDSTLGCYGISTDCVLHLSND